MSYLEGLDNISDITFDEIINLAKNNVPLERRDNPWIGLKHGLKLLSNEDELAQYISAYGIMHREKIYAALDTIPNCEEFFSKNITIIDWGCGQALATMCFYDYMRQRGIEPSISNVVLIEPSTIALHRAKEHIQKYSARPTIKLVNKLIDNVNSSDIHTINTDIVLHFFSNILDIDTINLKKLSLLIQNEITFEQFFFCVGPQNIGASRIAEFAKLFNITEKDLISKQEGFLRTRGTISMMTFKILSNTPEIIKVEFYRNKDNDTHFNTLLKRVIKDLPSCNSLSENALAFYRAVISLERMKSAGIGEEFYYPYTLEEENNNTHKVKFNIDICDNPQFETIFTRNLTPSITKWPKHLNIGLSINIDDTRYRLFEYIYPYTDLKDINIEEQFISVNLAMFSINSDIADNLELTENIIQVLTEILTNKETTLSDLESILQDAIGHNVSLHPYLSLTLSSEAPVFAQINSELKSLFHKKPSGLMLDFLTGSIKKNDIGSIHEDAIINVVDIDYSQRQAIATALNSKLSVITGPPGTGKTQMIVNLLANALLHGKSVLVASKNNKAVNNIKERFDNIDCHQYFLRFGSRDLITSKLLPTLDGYDEKIKNNDYDPVYLTSIREEYDKQCKLISETRQVLGEVSQLTDIRLDLENSLRQLVNHFTQIEKEYHLFLENLREDNKEIAESAESNKYNWDKTANNISKLTNTLYTYSFIIKRIFFNLFLKKKFSQRFQEDLSLLPTKITNHIENEIGTEHLCDVYNYNQLIQCCTIEQNWINRILEYRKNRHLICSRFEIECAKFKSAKQEINEKIHTVLENIKEISQSKSQEQLIEIIESAKKYISSIGADLVTELIKLRLNQKDSANIIAKYKNYFPDQIPWKDEELEEFTKNAYNFINIFNINSVTSLSVKSAFPLQENLFDIVIIDEASQCDVASALPLIYRAKQLVVIGDPLQLKHITSITTSEEMAIKEHLSLSENTFIRYASYSLWDYCHDLITSANINNRQIVLDNHYRCHPQIIGYSNEMFYQKRLGRPLKVCTNSQKNHLSHKGIIWVDVIGEQQNNIRKVNKEEVEKSLSIAVELAEKHKDITIGIISPFKHQIEEINAQIPEELRNRIVADTVHKFQGDERDVIIYSLVVTNNSPERLIKWIDISVPNLVNVAVTRARSTLYIVGNRDYIKQHSHKELPLGRLVMYTENNCFVENINQETFIIDTNVFVDCPDILNRINPNMQIIISAKVVDELDKLKVTLDDSKKGNAELALRYLNRSFDGHHIRMECADMEYLPVDFNRKNPDNMILSIALKYKNQNPILITSDNGLQLKAKGMRINTLTLHDFLHSNK